MQRATLKIAVALSCALVGGAPIARLNGADALSQAAPSKSAATTTLTEKEPKIPKFSVDYMDKSVKPANDFYHYASGTWVKNNPVPADKSRWGSFAELAERNNYLIHGILEEARSQSTGKEAAGKANTPKIQIGNFFASAMNTELLEKKRFEPIKSELAQVESIKNNDDLFKVLADFHKKGIGSVFDTSVDPDAKDSDIYAFQLGQGGLSLPDRDYYLTESFATQRTAYLAHLKKMFTLLGDSEANAAKNAATVMEVETALAKASRSRVDLRDPIKNYNKVTISKLVESGPSIPWKLYLNDRGIAEIPYAVVGQPEFFEAMNKLVKERPLADWKTYLRWQVLHNAAPFLHEEVENENFYFFGKTLSGQEQQEPRWKRSAKIIDRTIGEALGQLYVEKYFPPSAKARMQELVANLKEVFADHLQKLDWMGDETRKKAMLKFDRFVTKIGCPDKFRDYSSVVIDSDDYFGNVERAEVFEINRKTVRVGKPVDKSEWEMTPPTVNAYFNPLMNEIVFPAGILQPPFFDLSMDDPVNYGAIGAVIGHEITHGYDDQGRHFDAHGNLAEWWTDKDAAEFDKRAQKVIDEYDAFEALPGLHVNGKLTLGENIADLGGVSIAYDAMQRALKKDPAKRKNVEGFTPEQRFFLSFSQLWRINIRDAEAKRLITVDPHSPGKFRAYGPLINFEEFFTAFDIKADTPMWRAPDKRAKIW
ncbi:MAG: M13 family metallopeptidase [Cyanobacteria bacterium REEB67]|nr:M13 family metallopeptidase [Cyanobacteria bacterium REEB67]